MLSDSIVQAPVVGSQGQPITSRDVVDAHGDFHQHPIQRQKVVQELVGVALAENLIAQLAPLPFVLTRHGVHSAIYRYRIELRNGN